MSKLEYEGRIEAYDVEPGVGGDVIQLLDHPTKHMTLDALIENTFGWDNVWGKPFGPVRITVEKV